MYGGSRSYLRNNPAARVTLTVLLVLIWTLVVLLGLVTLIFALLVIINHGDSWPVPVATLIVTVTLIFVAHGAARWRRIAADTRTPPRAGDWGQYRRDW